LVRPVYAAPPTARRSRATRAASDRARGSEREPSSRRGVRARETLGSAALTAGRARQGECVARSLGAPPSPRRPFNRLELDAMTRAWLGTRRVVPASGFERVPAA